MARVGVVINEADQIVLTNGTSTTKWSVVIMIINQLETTRTDLIIWSLGARTHTSLDLKMSTRPPTVLAFL